MLFFFFGGGGEREREKERERHGWRVGCKYSRINKVETVSYYRFFMRPCFYLDLVQIEYKNR